MKKIFIALIFLIIVFAIYKQVAPNKNPDVASITSDNKPNEAPTIIADKLEIPWSLVFLPDKSVLFTERPGRVRLITTTGALLENPIHTIKDVKAVGEGGLLGIAIHPKFSTNNFVYIYYTYSNNDQNTLNKVVRFTYKNNSFQNETQIITSIPGNVNHNGGRLKFGPDGYLYVTTGDSQQPSLAQDTKSLAGKILRTTDEGKPVPGNPFNNLVYSYGHRNPQGLAWDDKGRLWETEHGPSTKDEINEITKGSNYGWPTVTGKETAYGMKLNTLNSGASTWAPSGLAYYDKSLLFAGLRSASLFKFDYSSALNSNLKQYFSGTYGRLRDIVLGPDGYLYICTSNMDGRALTHLDGDKIIRIHPSLLK